MRYQLDEPRDQCDLPAWQRTQLTKCANESCSCVITAIPGALCSMCQQEARHKATLAAIQESREIINETLVDKHEN